MIVIIKGQNRAEFCKVSNKNKEKHFFITGNQQLYKIYPDGLMRMKVWRNGKEQESEEVMIYKENEIIPYHVNGLEYNMDKLLADIDEHKQLQNRSFLGENAWMVNAGKSALKYMTSTGGIVVLVMIYVFLAGGQ